MDGLLFPPPKAQLEAMEWVWGRLYAFVLLPTFILMMVLLYRALFHPLARIPGPPLAAITGNWRNYRYLRGTWHNDILKLHKRYGRVVRIAPNEVSVVDGPAMKKLYGHGTSAKKTAWYHVWRVPGAGSAFFSETNPYTHGKLRKRVSAAYSMSAILRYEQYIQSCLDLFMWKITSFSNEGRVMDLADWVTALAFDIVGEIAFGTKFGHLETGVDAFDMRSSIARGFYIVSNSGHFWGQLKLFNNPVTQGILSALGGEAPLGRMQKFA